MSAPNREALRERARQLSQGNQALLSQIIATFDLEDRDDKQKRGEDADNENQRARSHSSD